ncbi:kinase-like domain-containing protein [Cokeromyces recurvatus]|uniref:kinase-like domain-containing protein n=1 Tax=Cokeromyces recurvatus TaxID=90255 RepID=UPI002220DAEB|nr:kinase-like domain-containing protein [Cokeromyces recurvatus]KAI7907587.1 kinase-like domain-containing protein [Cokeromyces recurvatus]
MGYSLLRGSQQAQGLEPASKESEQKLRREIAILKKCRHPNVVQLFEVIDVPESRKIYMALEYTENGEIGWRDEYDHPILSINEARRIFRDIVSGLDYLHYQGIIHRDIKPANLLLSQNGVAKISDFGVSYYNELLAANNTVQPTEELLNKIDRELAETAGTPAFFAPELCCAGDLFSSHKRPRISKAIDVWSLGVTLYCFIFGQCPFIAATEFELFDTIPTQPLTFPSIEQVGFKIEDNLENLLKGLLTKNPDERITLEQVKHHAWVTEDLVDPQEWISMSDPKRYISISVVVRNSLGREKESQQQENITIMERLRQSIKKLSFSFSGGNNRRRPSKQLSTTTSRPLSHQPTPTINTGAVYNNNYRHSSNINYHLPQPIMNKQPSSLPTTSLLSPTTSSATPTVSLSTGHTLIFNSELPNNSSHISSPSIHPLRPISSSCISDDSSSIIEENNEYYDTDDSPQSISMSPSQRPSMSRQISSASSSSGLGLTFGKYRSGMTPMEIMQPSNK